MSPAVKQFARDMAIQQIGYWRKQRMPKTRAFHRRFALELLRAMKTGVIR